MPELNPVTQRGVFRLSADRFADRGWRRRDFLRIGSLTALGLTWTAARDCSAAWSTASRRCILIWLDGGPSHLETFDPKPDAPAEVRGPFSSISTSIPGVTVSELLPNLARRLDDCAIMRNVTSPLGEHNLGAHYMLTGYKPTPVLQYPALGSVVGHLHRGPSVLPRHVAIPDFRVGGGKMTAQGFLPPANAPFAVGGDPSRPDFRVQGLDFYPGLDAARMRRRHGFVNRLNQQPESAPTASESHRTSTMDESFEQAYRLIISEDAKGAFDLHQESDQTRQRYGPRTIGQCCLLARRLIERGVPFVTVNHTGWDTHTDMVTRLKEGYTGAKVPVGLVPSLDLALSGLLDDLRDRGLLDETLVLVMGEFGRTPKLNTAGGRDHWPRVFSVLLAGGGVRGGQVIGGSDDVGQSPAGDGFTPADLACSVYSLLGIDPQQTLYTSDGRPVTIGGEGRPIRQLISG